MGHFIGLCFLFFGNNDLKLKEVYFTNVLEQYYLLAKPETRKGLFFSFFELALHSESLCWNTKFLISAPCDITEGNGASTHPG